MAEPRLIALLLCEGIDENGPLLITLRRLFDRSMVRTYPDHLSVVPYVKYIGVAGRHAVELRIVRVRDGYRVGGISQNLEHAEPDRMYHWMPQIGVVIDEPGDYDFEALVNGQVVGTTRYTSVRVPLPEPDDLPDN